MMQQLVSPIVPFPNIYWCLQALAAGEVLFDGAEHFVKMTYRNRYYITGSNGLITLSIPVTGGRNQRTPMSEVLIDHKDNWQTQHWRTITSVYGRSPYFEHYSVELEPFFTNRYEKLIDFNMAGINWIKKQLKANYKDAFPAAYATYPDADKDLRRTLKPGTEKNTIPEELYYQVFTERNGFYPNLSVLDLLFSEGPAAVSIIQQHRQTIESWGK